MDRERPLDADAERDLADRERLAQSSVLAADHHALEHLYPLATPLHHPDVHLHGVAWAELRDIRAQIGLLDEIGLVHDSGSRVYQRAVLDSWPCRWRGRSRVCDASPRADRGAG